MARFVEFNGITVIKPSDRYDLMAIGDLKYQLEDITWLLKSPNGRLLLKAKNQSVDMQEIHTMINQRAKNLRDIRQIVDHEVKKSLREARRSLN